MIEAKHNEFFRKIFNVYIDWQLKKYFNNFYLIDELNIEAKDDSLLVLPNHFSWWDGFFVDLIYRKLFSDYKLYMMVLEETIKKFWFFNHIGAFTINPKNPKDINKSFNYAAKLLKGTKNFVVIFPQGELHAYSTKVNLKKGVIDLIINGNCESNLLMLAMKILYLNEKKPDVFFHCKFSKAFDYRFEGQKFVDDFNENILNLETKISDPNYKKIKLL